MTENRAIAAIDADFDADAAADAAAVVEVGTNCDNVPLVSDPSAPNDPLSAVPEEPVSTESPSKFDSSALFLVASAQIAQRTDSAQTKKIDPALNFFGCDATYGIYLGGAHSVLYSSFRISTTKRCDV